MTITDSHNNITPSPLLSDEKCTREYKYKFCTFVLISLLQIFVNYDVGVVPVMLNWIQEPYNFTESELGIMGCLPYIGLVSASPLLSYVLLQYNNKNSLTLAFVFNIISLCIFGLAVNKYMFFISKFCIGFSQALFFIFYPIWVDTFAPESCRNLWMAVIQTGIICGATFGYILTSLYSYAGEWSWRYSIFTQITFELVLTVLFYLIPKEFINFDPSRDENINFDLCTCDKSKNVTINDESVQKTQNLDFILSRNSTLGINTAVRRSRIYSNFEHTMLKSSEYSRCTKCFLNNIKLHQEIINTKNLSVWSKFKLLIKQNIFILTCIGISMLYFEVTGMHYWMTKIGVSHLKMKENEIHLIFAIECILGPVLGIVSGSYLIDQIIYHYPDNPLFVDYTLIVWGTIPCILSIILITFQNPMTFAICIFIILFYGSALVPTLTLTSVAYLPPYLKPAGASFFICSYNILGFTLGTLIPGVAVDIFHTYTAALIVIFLSGFIGLVTYLFIVYIKWNRIKMGKLSSRYLLTNK